VINREKLVSVFGVTIGGAVFIFGLLSFPLAAYATNGFTHIGVGWSVLAVIGLYVFVPFGELIALLLAFAGLIDLVFY